MIIWGWWARGGSWGNGETIARPLQRRVHCFGTRPRAITHVSQNRWNVERAAVTSTIGVITSTKSIIFFFNVPPIMVIFYNRRGIVFASPETRWRYRHGRYSLRDNVTTPGTKTTVGRFCYGCSYHQQQHRTWEVEDRFSGRRCPEW